MKIKNSCWLTLLMIVPSSVRLKATEHPKAMNVIIFDVGGILGNHSQKAVIKKVCKDVGILRLAGAFFRNRDDLSHATLYRLMNRVLDEIGAKHYPSDQNVTYTDKGEPCGQGLCAWQAGLITGKAIGDQLGYTVDTLLKQGVISSKTQANMVQSIITTSMVDKHTLANSYRPIKEGVALLKALKENPHNRLVILSNFAPEQFEVLRNQEHMKPIFDEFDAIFYSGMNINDTDKLGLKPNHGTFKTVIEYCANQYHVEKNSIFFIDNQEENIVAAQACGITGLLVNGSSNSTNTRGLTFSECADYLNSQGLCGNNQENSYNNALQSLVRKILYLQKPHILKAAPLMLTAGCIVGIMLWEKSSINSADTLPASS